MPQAGFFDKLYRNTGTYGSPTWNEVPNVKDLTSGMQATEIDVTTRGSAGFKAYIAGLIDAGVDFNMIWDTSDADFTAIQTAFLARTGIEFLVLDGDVETPGSQGLRAIMGIFDFTREEPLDGAVEAKVKLKPRYVSDTAQAPSWYTVPGT